MVTFDACVTSDVAVTTRRLVDASTALPLPSSSSSTTVGHSLRRRLPPDVRRARHRDRMQRQRLAEKQRLERQRLEAHRLARELTRVTTAAARSATQQRYVRLVLQQQTIADENRHLAARCRAWQRFRLLVAAEQERVAPVAATTNRGQQRLRLWLRRHRPAGHWLPFVPDEPVLFYQPLAATTCHELVATAYQRLLDLARGPGARALYSEAFGWTVRFSVSPVHRGGDGGRRRAQMQHRFAKRIRAVDAQGDRVTGDTLAQATWTVLRTPALYAQLYRTPLTSAIVQQVDARTSVLLRTSPDENAVMSRRFVCVVAQVHDDAGDEATDATEADRSARHRRVTIVSSVLDPHRVFPYIDTNVPDAPYEWLRDGMTYLSFTELDDEAMVEIEYGGLTNVGRETASCTGLPFAAMNMGEALVRWEQFVTPMRTLGRSDP